MKRLCDGSTNRNIYLGLGFRKLVNKKMRSLETSLRLATNPFLSITTIR